MTILVVAGSGLSGNQHCSAHIRMDGYFSHVNQISWSSAIAAADGGTDMFPESPGEIWRSGSSAVDDIRRIRAGDALRISSIYISDWNAAHEHETWPKVSGDLAEAKKLAAALQTAVIPDYDLPAGQIPEYTVTRQCKDGVSSWIVTTSIILPESGQHRGFFDAGETSLYRNPLDLAFEILEAFD